MSEPCGTRHWSPPFTNFVLDQGTRTRALTPYPDSSQVFVFDRSWLSQLLTVPILVLFALVKSGKRWLKAIIAPPSRSITASARPTSISGTRRWERAAQLFGWDILCASACKLGVKHRPEHVSQWRWWEIRQEKGLLELPLKLKKTCRREYLLAL